MVGGTGPSNYRPPTTHHQPPTDGDARRAGHTFSRRACTLWITALVAIGVCVTGRMPMKEAAIAAAIVWFVGGLPLIIPALRSM